MVRLQLRSSLALLLAGVAAAGCGGPTRGLSSGDAARLRDQLGAARAAAAAGDAPGVARELALFRADVTRLGGSGRLTTAQAQTLAAGAAQAQARAPLDVKAPVQQAPAATAPTETAPTQTGPPAATAPPLQAAPPAQQAPPAQTAPASPGGGHGDGGEGGD
jgi:hypothetical protein